MEELLVVFAILLVLLILISTFGGAATITSKPLPRQETFVSRAEALETEIADGGSGFEEDDEDADVNVANAANAANAEVEVAAEVREVSEEHFQEYEYPEEQPVVDGYYNQRYSEVY